MKSDSPFRYLVAGFAGVLLGALISFRPPAVQPPPAVDREAVKEAVKEAHQPEADVPPEGLGFGWHRDPDEVALTISMMEVKVFSTTPAGRSAEALPNAVYLWKAFEVLGYQVPQKDQNPTGSCVGFGTTTAIENTLASEIAGRFVIGMGDASELAFFSEEVTYAGSRVEANGGRCPIPARNDGSNGSWAARWATGKTPTGVGGMCPKAKYGNLDLTNYSASRAHDWNNTGVPDFLEPECLKYRVADAVRIVKWDDAKRAIANGYGIAVCSDVGFNRQRDANGVAKPGPEWQHCMCLNGYHVEGGKEYGHIENSWAKTGYHVGPVGWGNPTPAGFWAESAVIDRMLRQGDSWAYSGAKGFPKQSLDWFAVVPVKRKFFPIGNFRRDVKCDTSFSLAF